MGELPQKLKKQTQAHSFAVAFASIGRALKSELHMKIHACVAVLALLACWVLGVEPFGWCLVIICIGCVIAAELFNTALEALADKVSPEYDPLIKVAKDTAAGAVLVLAIMAVVVGLVVFVPKLLQLLG